MEVTVTPTRRRGAGRRTTRQRELLDQLVVLFAAEGFADFTLDDLVARLKCSKSSLYTLAGSKQELVVEVVKQYFRDSVPQVEAAVLAASDPRARVVAYLNAVGTYLAPLSRKFTADMAGFGPAAEVYRFNTEAAADRIRDLIADGIAAGTFRAVNAGFAAEMVAATMFEIQRGQMFSRLELTDAEAYAELASLIVHALAPAPSS